MEHKSPGFDYEEDARQIPRAHRAGQVRVDCQYEPSKESLRRESVWRDSRTAGLRHLKADAIDDGTAPRRYRRSWSGMQKEK